MESTKTEKFKIEKSKQKRIHIEINTEMGANAVKASTLAFFIKKIRAEHKKSMSKTRIWVRKQSNMFYILP